MALTQGLEGAAQLLGKDFWLFPGGEVAALVNLVPIHDVAEATLAPASRRRIDLGRKHGNGDRELRDMDCVERAAASLRSFPVGSGRGRPGVCQPVEGYRVKHLVEPEDSLGLTVAVGPLGEFVIVIRR